MTATILTLTEADVMQRLGELSSILTDTVADGAAVSFMAPLSREDASAFWARDVAPEIGAGRRRLFVAEIEGATVGTAQLITAMPPNQPHRCEIAKMLVHPRARRRGVARALMRRAIDEARALGKTLVTLDTRTGDVSQDLYRSLGFEEAGTIPDFAFDPYGCALHSTTYMFLRLGARA
ncbi:MAG: GNAT family N-acetyltransferase [Microvirga sp.]|nr:GNAT family N-acetyltransferase [Microvirga sp.]